MSGGETNKQSLSVSSSSLCWLEANKEKENPMQQNRLIIRPDFSTSWPCPEIKNKMNLTPEKKHPIWGSRLDMSESPIPRADSDERLAGGACMHGRRRSTYHQRLDHQLMHPCRDGPNMGTMSNLLEMFLHATCCWLSYPSGPPSSPPSFILNIF